MFPPIQRDAAVGFTKVLPLPRHPGHPLNSVKIYGKNIRALQNVYFTGENLYAFLFLSTENEVSFHTKAKVIKILGRLFPWSEHGFRLHSLKTLSDESIISFIG